MTEQFPDPTLLQLQAEAHRQSAQIWRQAFNTQRRAALYAAVPGLLCGIGVVLAGDARWWLAATAGAAIASSLASLLGAGVSLWRDRRERKINE